VRARALRTPVFFSSLPHQAGRCAPPPPAHRSFAAYYSTPKNKQNLSNLGRPRQRLFFFPLDHMQTAEAMKCGVPCPRPTHRSFADPSSNILGSKLCTGATIRPIFSVFSFFDFGSFVFVILCFFLSPFYFILIHLFLFFCSHLFLLFL
jgi:hypothetical protein